MSIERCINCDEPTGRAGEGEDSIFAGGVGPLCDDCFAGVKQAMDNHSADTNKMVELRPMREAPRNETSILLYYKDETEAHPVVGWWPLAQRKGSDVFSTTENFLLAPECFKGWLPIPQVEVKP